jgi:hypothetical protein
MDGAKDAAYGDRGRIRTEVLTLARYPMNCVYAVEGNAWMDKERIID